MIRRATVDDVPRMAEIHIFGWRCAYRGLVSDEILFKKMGVEKRIESFKKAIIENREETYVFEEEGIIKGVMTVGPCRNEDKQSAFELWGIYIEPLMKRQGIGRRCVEYCERIAQERGYKENVLWVFEKNETAKMFYERLGYKPDGKEALLEKYSAKEVRYIKKL